MSPGARCRRTAAFCRPRGTPSTICSKGFARCPRAGRVRRSTTRPAGLPARCGSSLLRYAACALHGGSRGHALRPRIAARILISSSLHNGYGDLKLLSSRFASRCLANDDGGQIEPQGWQVHRPLSFPSAHKLVPVRCTAKSPTSRPTLLALA